MRNTYLMLEDKELLAQCDETRYRGSGPGGQKRNKTENAVLLTHRKTGIAAKTSESRSLLANRKGALRLLRFRLSTEIRLPPGPLSEELSTVIQNRPTKAQRAQPWHFVALSELLDAFVQYDLSIAETASQLQTKTSTISRILNDNPLIQKRVNEWRQQKGLSTLR